MSGISPDGLSVNSRETPLGLGGYDRPAERCENIEEIVRRYAEKKQPTIFCAYCDQSIRVLRVDDAIRWFRTHECDAEGKPVNGTRHT